MKVRITQNSIRFRLKQTEVQHFKERRSISEVVVFGDTTANRLGFTLQCAAAGRMSVSFQHHTVTVQVPEATAAQWTQTDMVGIEENITTTEGNTIHLLIEKDFACLDASAEENIDTYPNPNAVCK